MNSPINKRWQRLVKPIDSFLYRLRILRRYCMWRAMNGRCTYCGTPIAFNQTTVDHMVALRMNGTDRSGNIYPACRPCNGLKGSMDLRQFAAATIGRNRFFYFQSGVPIDVVRARLWIKLYGLLHKQKVKSYYLSSTRENLIRKGVIKPQ